MSSSDIEVILYRLAEMDKKIDSVIHEQKAIASRGICPNPGACIILQRDVEVFKASAEDREERLRKIESMFDQMRGAGVAAKAVWAFIGAGGLGVVVVLYQLIQK